MAPPEAHEKSGRRGWNTAGAGAGAGEEGEAAGGCFGAGELVVVGAVVVGSGRAGFGIKRQDLP